MWFLHHRADVGTLPDLYARSASDLTTIITISYSPSQYGRPTGLLDLYIEVLYPPAPVSFSLLIPTIAENISFITFIAATGKCIVVPEATPDWNNWAQDMTEAELISAIVEMYQRRGFVIELSKDLQESFTYLLEHQLLG